MFFWAEGFKVVFNEIVSTLLDLGMSYHDTETKACTTEMI